MKINCLILIFVLLIGCGKTLLDPSTWGSKPVVKDPRRNNSTNTELGYYVGRFETSYGKKVDDVPVNFANDLDEKLGKGVAGVCWAWTGGQREVEINSNYWSDFTDEQREQLVFHELGHCVLNKSHDDGTDGDNCPSSIMRPQMFSFTEIEDCYLPKYKDYIKNLFN